MTFSAWVNYDSFQHWSRIFDFGDAAGNNNILLANQTTTNNLALEIRAANGTSGGQLVIENFWSANTWIHVTATISDTGLMRIYKNGELAGELQSTVIPTEKVRNHNYIGRSNWSSDSYFDGQLDEITISNSALDSSEVQSLYQDSLNNISDITEVSYNFAEGSGSQANDSNGSNSNLTLNNGVQWQSDSATGHNSILNFDGTNDYGNISNLETGGAMTFSAWVNYDSFQSWSRIFDFGDGESNNNIVLANRGTTNNLALEIRAANGTSGGQLVIENFWSANTWIHVTATISDTGLMRVYKNGELAGELQSSVIPTEKVRNNNYIGRSNWSSDGYFDGQLDDVTISNNALDSNQVQSLYQTSLNKNSNITEVSYNFAEGSGTQANNSNGSNGNLTLHNGVQWQDDSATGHNSILDFDGTNDYGSINGLETGGAMTFSAWVNYDSFQHWSHIFDFSDENSGNGIYLSNASTTNDLRFKIYGADGSEGYMGISDFWQANTWTHVTATFDETGLMRVYKNGELAAENNSGVIVQKMVRTNTNIGSNSFDGQLDDITILNSALDSNQVQSLYQASFNTLYSSEVSYNFTEGSGTQANNSNGSNGNLTLHNGVQWQDDSATDHNSILDFDGTNDYGSINGLETGGAMTFSAWVNYDSFQNWSRIFDFSDENSGNGIYLSNASTTNDLRFRVYGADGSEGYIGISDFWQVDTWIHVTATVDETGLMRVYKNGELAAENNSGVIPQKMVRANTSIGNALTGSNFFDGQLDDITISNSALDSNQVQSLYQTSLSTIALDNSSDILRGGYGNDAIDGGEGKDIIFGEDELDNSSYIYAPYIDGAFTRGHSSYLLD